MSGETPEQKEAYLVFSWYHPENHIHMNHIHIDGCSLGGLDTLVRGVIVSSDARAITEHQYHSYPDNPEGIKKMQAEMNGEFVKFPYSQNKFGQAIIDLAQEEEKKRRVR